MCVHRGSFLFCQRKPKAFHQKLSTTPAAVYKASREWERRQGQLGSAPALPAPQLPAVLQRGLLRSAVPRWGQTRDQVQAVPVGLGQKPALSPRVLMRDCTSVPLPQADLAPSPPHCPGDEGNTRGAGGAALRGEAGAGGGKVKGHNQQPRAPRRAGVGAKGAVGARVQHPGQLRQRPRPSGSGSGSDGSLRPPGSHSSAPSPSPDDLQSAAREPTFHPGPRASYGNQYPPPFPSPPRPRPAASLPQPLPD